ncbi:hypothetical protein FNF31_00229 [Cafeteria roenbergensis]|uniref:Rab-GAP TBC domain-containing protein n=1 Tax=Cafeteria roenbergensis TaxID=33653 RepID=A0A5A8DV27_CAFRO|nr:hypothetical protein FNF28_02637 [Cafeteria roenbergensis]KAA0169069.1 hypothetical protein FNF31_00229 [Cafeteria roenbergensis]
MPRPDRSRSEELVEYRRIISVDVPRTFHFSECAAFGPEARKEYAANLTDVLVAAVERSAAVHYYQGLNSVAAAALLAKGKDEAQVFVDAFLRVHGAPFCAATLQETQAVLGLVARLVQLLDPSLAELVDSDPVLAQYTSALGPLMTWHTHGSESAKEASIWLKELSSRHPLAAVYVAAAEVIGQRTPLRRAMTASSMEARCAAYGLIGKAALAYTVKAAARVWDSLSGSAAGAVGTVSSWLVAP